MNSKVILRKIGNFYHAFDNDALIIAHLFSYKLRYQSCGFPKSSLEKVINRLQEEHINYIIIDEQETIYEEKENNYSLMLDEAKEEFELENCKENIISTIDNLTIEELKIVEKTLSKEIK